MKTDDQDDNSPAPFSSFRLHPSSFSYFPSIPPPIELKLTELPEHPCPYLPGRTARNRGFWADKIPGDLYRDLMDAAFRRSGKVVYQPICTGCRQCVPIRVPVNRFKQSKSQRRCWRKNADLRVEIGHPELSDAKLQLYEKYVAQWHGSKSNIEADDLKMFLYDSPVPTAEFVYRNAADDILAVGICDIGDDSLSSVYFYFDPEQAHRSLGTFGALFEIEYARSQLFHYYYLGYWIKGCAAMKYKTSYRPCELLGTDGAWRTMAETASTSD